MRRGDLDETNQCFYLHNVQDRVNNNGFHGWQSSLNSSESTIVCCCISPMPGQEMLINGIKWGEIRNFYGLNYAPGKATSGTQAFTGVRNLEAQVSPAISGAVLYSKRRCRIIQNADLDRLYTRRSSAHLHINEAEIKTRISGKIWANQASELLGYAHHEPGGDSHLSVNNNKQHMFVTLPPSLTKDFVPKSNPTNVKVNFSSINCMTPGKATSGVSSNWKNEIRVEYLLHYPPLQRSSSRNSTNIDLRVTEIKS